MLIWAPACLLVSGLLTKYRVCKAFIATEVPLQINSKITETFSVVNVDALAEDALQKSSVAGVSPLRICCGYDQACGDLADV